MDWTLILIDPNEVAIVDKIAEKAAKVSLARDAKTFGYILSNARVSRLGEMKIIRMDVYDPKQKENVGIAIRTETKHKVDDGINIF